MKAEQEAFNRRIYLEYQREKKRYKQSNCYRIMELFGKELEYFATLFWGNDLAWKESLERSLGWLEKFLDHPQSRSYYLKRSKITDGTLQKSDYGSVIAGHNLAVLNSRTDLVNKVQIFFKDVVARDAYYYPITEFPYALLDRELFPDVTSGKKKIAYEALKKGNPIYYPFDKACDNFLENNYKSIQPNLVKCFFRYCKVIKKGTYYESHPFYSFLALARYFKDQGVKIKFPKFDHPWEKQLELLK